MHQRILSNQINISSCSRTHLHLMTACRRMRKQQTRLHEKCAARILRRCAVLHSQGKTYLYTVGGQHSCAAQAAQATSNHHNICLV